MAIQTPERTSIELAPLFPGKYLSVTSYKRDGTPVATPLWFVIDGERLLAMTDPSSGKAKRIRRNPVVTVAPCSAGGRLRGTSVPGLARFLDDEEIPRVERMIAHKYRMDRVLILPVYRLVQWLRGNRGSGAEAVLAIAPDV